MSGADLSSVDTIEIVSAVLGSKDEAMLSSSLREATRRCGFEMFMIAVETRNPVGVSTRFVSSNYPDAWQQIYTTGNYAETDPTVTHCQSRTEPMLWTESAFKNVGALPLLEEARSHGIVHGVSVPTHERINTKSMLSLARDAPLNNDPRELVSLVAAAQVLASCAHFAASRIQSAKLRQSWSPSLTPQERCCLRWAAQGKTSWETGQIMNISEPTVIFHLRNTMKKLNVSNRAQALVAAIWLGLMD